MSILQRLIFYFPLSRFKIQENSMLPSFKNGDEVGALKYFYKKPKVGDVIIFSHTTPPHILIKRITKIVNGKYMVAGDNKKESIKSAKIGLVDFHDIIGRVIFKI